MATKKQEKQECKFTKAELLKSTKIGYSKDVINAILNDDEKYTIEEAVKLLKTFMEGEK